MSRNRMEMGDVVQVAKLVGGERAGFDEEEEGERTIDMVKGKVVYDQAADARNFQGLMTLDQIKEKRGRIENGEGEFASESEKMAKAKKVDDILAAKEARVGQSLPAVQYIPFQSQCTNLLNHSGL